MSATYKLGTMILPQLEAGAHGVNVVGMFFFDDNLFCLREGDEIGERLAKIAAEQNILLMVCDQCAVRRNLAEGTFEQCGSGDVTAKGLVAGSERRLLPAALHGARPRRARPRHHAVGVRGDSFFAVGNFLFPVGADPLLGVVPQVATCPYGVSCGKLPRRCRLAGQPCPKGNESFVGAAYMRPGPVTFKTRVAYMRPLHSTKLKAP